MAGGRWTKVKNKFSNLDAHNNNVYKVVDGRPNVHVYLDLDTVGFNHTSEANLRDLITETVETEFGTTCSTEITGYTVSSYDMQPTMFEKLDEDDIYVRTFEKRYMRCRGCKDDRREREQFEVRVFGKKKPDLLEIELIGDICRQAVDVVQSVAQRQGAIWIISNDPLFSTKLFANLKNRSVQVYSMIPTEYMFAVPMYKSMTR